MSRARENLWRRANQAPLRTQGRLPGPVRDRRRRKQPTVGLDRLARVTPQTRYAAVGDADVAYQVAGNGPFDLVDVTGLGSHVELVWDVPQAADMFNQLSSFSRLIALDRRGTGASDGVPRSAVPTWEEWAEDVRVVMDSVGSERAAVLAEVDTGPIAILFAAMQPARVSALVLSNTWSRYLAADDYPIGASPETTEAAIDMLASMWGSDELARAANPYFSDDEIHRVARMMRAAATPRTAAAQWRYLLTSDVRQALPLIQAPTLVVHFAANPFVRVNHGRYLADHIPGAKFIELPGAGTSIWANPEVAVPDVAEFLTGRRPPVHVDRILTTILFTDIVASTEAAAAIGDHRWRSILDSHDRLVREQLRHFRGREIKTTGDGFLASFDGPARGIRCARAIVEKVEPLGIQVRAGIHTGECEVRGDDLGGLAVHIAARVGALAGPGDVLVSGTVRDLVVGSEIRFADQGEHQLRGVPGTWKLFSVTR
jgi:class 3 adenylate cyclase